MQSFLHDAKHLGSYFASHGQKITYKKHQCLIRPEDDNPWVYYLASGFVDVAFSFNTGERRLIGFFIPGSTFAQSGSFFKDEGGGLEYTAITDTIVYRLARTDFFELMRKETNLNEDYLMTLLKNQLFLIDRVVYQGESGIRRKVLRWLLFMSKYYCEKSDKYDCKIAVPLTQEMIADFMHTSRESVSKTIHALTVKDFIHVEKKHIIIHSIDALRSELET